MAGNGGIGHLKNVILDAADGRDFGVQLVGASGETFAENNKSWHRMICLRLSSRPGSSQTVCAASAVAARIIAAPNSDGARVCDPQQVRMGWRWNTSGLAGCVRCCGSQNRAPQDAPSVAEDRQHAPAGSSHGGWWAGRGPQHERDRLIGHVESVQSEEHGGHADSAFRQTPGFAFQEIETVEHQARPGLLEQVALAVGHGSEEDHRHFRERQGFGLGAGPAEFHLLLLDGNDVRGKGESIRQNQTDGQDVVVMRVRLRDDREPGQAVVRDEFHRAGKSGED